MPRELLPPEFEDAPESADPGGAIEPSGPTPEQPTEQEPLRESIETVAALLDAWKTEYDATEDNDRKRELAYRMVKMDIALQASGLRADEVTIRESEPGVLGFYVLATGEIAITPAGLNLPAEHFADVLVHEATHAAGFADEGVTQIITRQKVAGAMPGIYEAEQQDVRDTSKKVGTASFIEAYDFDNPKELIELYLDVEWHDAWRDTWQAKLGDRPGLDSAEGRQELLKTELQDWTDQLEENFEKAAPRLFAKAKESGFDFSKAHEAILSTTITESLATAAESA